MNSIHRYWSGEWEGLTQWAWWSLNAGVLLMAGVAGYLIALEVYLVAALVALQPVVYLGVRYVQAAGTRNGGKST